MKKISKKILSLSIIAFILSVFLSFSLSNLSFADTHSFEGRSGNDCPTYLGLIPWDCNIKITDQDSLKSGILQIAANVASDISVIAAYLIIGYVIYGGYLFIFSSGDPGKVATGKKALAHAFIGLAITMSAYAIMSTIRVALINNGNISNNNGQLGGSPSQVIFTAIHWVSSIAGIVSAIFIVFGGISYTTSGGDPSKTQKAKSIILYALIGLIVVALAEIITAFVASTIRNANENAYLNQTTISKEVHEIKSN